VDKLVGVLSLPSYLSDKLRFNEGDAIDTPDVEDLLARLDADFALLIGAVSRMMESMKKLLGGYAR
jgi:DNA recombination-dependent growth factor C